MTTLSDLKFKVGDVCAVVTKTGWERRRCVDRKMEVARVMKAFVQMSDGSKWTHGGYAYPRSSRGYSRCEARLEKWTDEHADIVRKDRAIMIIERFAGGLPGKKSIARECRAIDLEVIARACEVAKENFECLKLIEGDGEEEE